MAHGPCTYAHLGHIICKKRHITFETRQLRLADHMCVCVFWCGRVSITYNQPLLIPLPVRIPCPLGAKKKKKHLSLAESLRKRFYKMRMNYRAHHCTRAYYREDGDDSDD